MGKKQVAVYCKKNDVRFGEVYFKKGTFYQAEYVHDLLLFTGEKNNIIQIEQIDSNTFFHEYFTLVLSSSAEISNEPTNIAQKVRA